MKTFINKLSFNLMNELNESDTEAIKIKKRVIVESNCIRKELVGESQIEDAKKDSIEKGLMSESEKEIYSDDDLVDTIADILNIKHKDEYNDNDEDDSNEEDSEEYDEEEYETLKSDIANHDYSYWIEELNDNRDSDGDNSNIIDACIKYMSSDGLDKLESCKTNKGKGLKEDTIQLNPELKNWAEANGYDSSKDNGNTTNANILQWIMNMGKDDVRRKDAAQKFNNLFDLSEADESDLNDFQSIYADVQEEPVYFKDKDGKAYIIKAEILPYKDPSEYDNGYTDGWNKGENPDYDDKQKVNYKKAKQALADGDTYVVYEVSLDTLEPKEEVASIFGKEELKGFIDNEELKRVKVKKSLGESSESDEERLASLKTQLEKDGDQLADDEKESIEKEISDLEDRIYGKELKEDSMDAKTFTKILGDMKKIGWDGKDSTFTKYLTKLKSPEAIAESVKTKKKLHQVNTIPDDNFRLYYKDDDGNMYCDMLGDFYNCTPEGEPNETISYEDYDLTESIDDYKHDLSISFMAKIFTQMRKDGWDGNQNTADEYFDNVMNKLKSSPDKSIEKELGEAEVKGLKMIKNQGNVFMLEDENKKIIVGENYNNEEHIIENAEIYEDKANADKDYLGRCDIKKVNKDDKHA